MDRVNGNCSKTDPCDTVEHLNEKYKQISYMLFKYLFDFQ